MFKKIEIWVLGLIIVIFFIVLIFFGALLRSDNLGSKRFPNLQKVAVFLSEIPYNLKTIIINIKDPGDSLRVDNPRHLNKQKFTRYIDTFRDELLILARYDQKMKKSVVEIIDLNKFKILHQYKINVHNINKKTDTSRYEFSRLNIDHSPSRYEFGHPLILDDGSLIAHAQYSPIFKVDFCGKLLWVNDDDNFHHAINLDHNNDIWVPTKMYPYSDFVSYYRQDKKYYDDAITKINLSGKITYQKSLSEILIKNNIVGENLFLTDDPLHLNDIEPALTDGTYWKKGDVFLSIRDLGLVVLFRPSNEKVLKVIKGNFSGHHDVDILNDSQISIFNNNSVGLDDKFSEILIYDFDKEKIEKKYSKILESLEFKTDSEGLIDYLNDGSFIIEEQNEGRLLLINKNQDLEWEFINKGENGKIYVITWSRIIKDNLVINSIKNLIKNRKCN